MKTFFIIHFTLFISIISSVLARNQHLNFVLGEDNLGRWKDEIMSVTAEAPGPANVATLVLAEKRTKRPDILSGFKRYQGGWDISNKHYWASVGFTGVIGFTLAILWFLSFGLALVIHHCWGWRVRIKGKESRYSHGICLIILIILTCAAAIGCTLLSVGQDEFHDEALHTLKYVVNQSDYTVQTLRNVTQYFSIAKTINVAQVILPSDAKDSIDKLNLELNSAADTLDQKTRQNSSKIKEVFNAVRSALITVAAVMLLLSILGLCLSILGNQHAIHIFIISGWILVAVTFILCGVFVILNNSISDTCMAMEEWVENPHAETALSNILPCVDQETTNHTLYQSKQVINDIANIVNTYIEAFANQNPTHQQNQNPNYYNQSGPQVPHLCYPYDSQLQDRQCSNQEVSMANASLVWENYTCTVSETGFCGSTGRLKPEMYEELVGVVNISYALEHYTPPILSFQDCNFVRDTFRIIISEHCPRLKDHLHVLNVGLSLISVGLMLSLTLWMLYADRPQRVEVFAKLKGYCKAARRVKTNFAR